MNGVCGKYTKKQIICKAGKWRTPDFYCSLLIFRNELHTKFTHCLSIQNF